MYVIYIYIAVVQYLQVATSYVALRRIFGATVVADNGTVKHTHA